MPYHSHSAGLILILCRSQRNTGRPIPIRRLQPLVEYVEVGTFCGPKPSDLIPTTQYAERTDKKMALDGAAGMSDAAAWYRSGI